MRSKYKVADVLEAQSVQIDSICKNTWKSRTLHAIRKCRTAALGGHIDSCSSCGQLHLSYNSCRNRHCPTCQGHKREQWIQAREKELLDVPYFHVVFTLPHQLNSYCIQKPNLMYQLLFKTAWEVMHTFSKDNKYLGAKTGMIALLHTWGQNLQLHPHLHCIVPSGGVTKNGKWKKSKNKGKFLFPVKAMSRVFRAKFIAKLRKEKVKIPQCVIEKLFTNHWVVYAKRPFKNSNNIIEYLGRYAYKIAISNQRIYSIDKEKVTFYAKNYKKSGKKQRITLSHKEFIRRFALHILPKGFRKIRHYGILSSSWKKKHLKDLQKKLKKNKKKQTTLQKPILHRKCPICKQGILTTVATFNPYRPPPDLKLLSKKLNTLK